MSLGIRGSGTTGAPYVVAAGTDTYTATYGSYAAYVTGDQFEVLFTNTNTGASTININGIGPIAIKKNGTVALDAGDIQAGSVKMLVYDGTNFQMTPVGTVNNDGSGTLYKTARWFDADTIVGGSITDQNVVATSGAVTQYILQMVANTGQTASTEIFGFSFPAFTRQWATGALATQREWNIASPTYGFVGASTITNAYTLYITSPTAGVNATITNSWALGLNGNLRVVGVGASAPLFTLTATALTYDFTGSGTQGYLYVDASYSELSSYASGASLQLNAGTTGPARITLDHTGKSVSFLSPISSSLTNADFLFTGAAHTTLTASTEKISLNLNFGQTSQHATGALATQRAVVITAPTYSFVGASTITNAYTLFVTASTAGANATITSNWALGISGAVSIAGIVATSGSQQGFLFTGSANTGQTASTEINRVLWTTSSRQWATGAITEQNEFKITSPTYSFVGASTITDASTLTVAAPTAGANATLTRANSLYLTHATVASTYLKVYELSTTTVALETGTELILSSATNGVVRMRLNSATRYTFSANTVTSSPAATSGSIVNAWTFTAPINTNQTASTERSGILWTLSGRQWATGAIATQREYRLTAPAYSFVGASVITNAYTFYVEAPTAGANATITNTWAAGLEGSLLMVGGWIASSVKVIDTTAGDSATINAPWGRFRKDVTGTTFTLTNSMITANSVVVLTPANAAVDATALYWTVSAAAGSATITFVAAPTANFDMNFAVLN